MLSKQQIKFINSLKIKKYRHEHSCFLAEGTKLVLELLVSPLKIEYVVVSNKWLSKNVQSPFHTKVLEIDDKLFTQISTQSNPDGIMAIVHMPKDEINPSSLPGKWTIAVDSLQDPGNLGTIIRIADWFGIERVLCTTDTVDVYNPKTIQATMGSIVRVKVNYTDLAKLFADTDAPVYSTTMKGKTIYELSELESGIILIGNEANGISSPLLDLSSQQLSIPGHGTAESLNAGIAAGIIVAHLVNLNSKL